jgi:N-acetyl-alpha-D-muramate 1-phosphate uridylyltransferase
MSLPVAILAGGMATRLRPLTNRIPKVLLDVAGKPFAVRQIELLRQHGFKEIVFCLGYLGEQVRASLGDGSHWGVKLNYVFDGADPLGTGGALRKALPWLGEAFVVLYGDSYLDCDYEAVVHAFEVSGKQGLMTVFRNAGQWDRSNVLFQQGNIRRYDKRLFSPDMQHIDYGLGVLRSSVLKAYPTDKSLDLAKVYQDLLTRNELAGFEVEQRFYEIGSPAGLEETRKYFSKGRCEG